MFNMPPGVTAILPNCITGRGRELHTEFCENCEREIEYDDDRDSWSFAHWDAPLGTTPAFKTEVGWFCHPECHETFQEKKDPATAMVRQGLGLVVNGGAA